MRGRLSRFLLILRSRLTMSIKGKKKNQKTLGNVCEALREVTGRAAPPSAMKISGPFSRPTGTNSFNGIDSGHFPGGE